MRVYNQLINFISTHFSNTEIFAICLLLCFTISTRIFPFSFITFLFLFSTFLALFTKFYFYVNRIAVEENKNELQINYSWGFVKEKEELISSKTLYTYLRNKDFAFYLDFLNENKFMIILFVFLFGDFIIAIRNLSINDMGAYFMISLFCKFVFVTYFMINNIYNEILKDELLKKEETENKILDAFYKHLNGFLSLSFFLFIFFFILSRYIVEIFFGQFYIPFHTSLPFIFLANISLLSLLIIYKTSVILDVEKTHKILKIFVPIFVLVFLLSGINYMDGVTYFVIGLSGTLSIFLYNIIVRKPAYIESTYNHLF